MTKSQNAQQDDDSFWNDDETAFVREEPDTKPVYDLEERTARFSEAVVDFAKNIPQSAVMNRIISQLVGAGTSNSWDFRLFCRRPVTGEGLRLRLSACAGALCPVKSCSRPNVFETRWEAQRDRVVRTLEFLQSQAPDFDEAVESPPALAAKQDVVCNNHRKPNSRLQLLTPVSGFLSSNSQFNDSKDAKATPLHQRSTINCQQTTTDCTDHRDKRKLRKISANLLSLFGVSVPSAACPPVAGNPRFSM